MPTQRKTPFRPRKQTEISQAYNDGIVSINTVTDGAAAGLLPAPTLTEKARLCYQERALGIRRYYDAKQNQINIQRVIRVPRPAVEITNQDVAVTENGKRYRIDLIQTVSDIYPPSLDLTLVDYDQNAR